MINNNMIVLGADIEMGASFGMDADADTSAVSEKNVINILAREIKWQTFDDKEFRIPADFAKHSSYYGNDTTVMTDTAYIAPDTVAAKIPQPTQKLAPKQSSRPKSKSKTTPSKDIRKPD